MICRGEGGWDGWSGHVLDKSALYAMVARVARYGWRQGGSMPQKGTAGPQTPSGGWCAPDCVHKGPPRSSQPPSPLRTLMGFSLG